MFTTQRIAKSRGFTLVEAIVVIVITGIIGGMVAVFIRSPVQGYMDAQRRSELTDVADTAIRRIARDIHMALPNSVRLPQVINANDQCIEFIPTKIGARYRAAVDAVNGATTGYGDPLDFTTVDGAFDMLWPNSDFPADSRIAAGDVVVVYNDGSANGNAYSGKNAIQVDKVASAATATGTLITFVAPGSAPFDLKKLPSESPFGRFHIIPAASHVVSYRCNNGMLTRNTRVLTAAWGQPANCAAMVLGATPTVLANHVSTCSLTYDPPGSSTGLSRFGIVSMSLGITDSGETVNLYDQVHVDNTP